MTEYTPAQLEAWAGLGPWCAHETKWDVWDVVEIYDLNASCDDDPIAHLYRVNPWPEGAAADAFRDDKTNAALIAAAPDLARLVLEKEKEIAALQAFKNYVHDRLDKAGIPTHPDGEHSKAGCRIGDRLDVALAARQAMKGGKQS